MLYSENSLYKNIHKYFSFLSWNKMLFLSPNWHFLLPVCFSSVLQPSHSRGICWTLTCCVSNTKPCATTFAWIGEVCLCCFSRNLTVAQIHGPLLPQPSRGSSIAQGVLFCCWVSFEVRPSCSWDPPACQTLLAQCNSYFDYSTKVRGFHFLTLASHNTVKCVWIFQNVDRNLHQFITEDGFF